MYTQCPNCEFAFKVTAEDLKTAGGQILCGKCGKAFSALSYLSENKPEVTKTDSGPTEGNSAEQNAAFLKTLDDLAGSNIRILDTGAEWQVLDEEEAGIEAESSVDEQRFDDNTPLPDEFGANDEFPIPAESDPTDDPIDEDDDPELLGEEPQPGAALSEPDEWKDILGEFMDLAKEVAAPVEGIDRELDTEDGEDTAVQLSKVAANEPISEETLNEEPEEGLHDDQNIADGKDDWEFDSEIEQLDLIDEQTSLEEDSVVASHAIENELNELSGEHYVPPMTEDEHTANMQIDQDLMAFAVEDEDGFISTIVIPEEKFEKEAIEQFGMGEGEESPTGVESIIMEGETVRTAIENEELAEAVAEALKPIEISREDETEKTEKTEEPGGPRYGMIAAVVLLMLTLTGQVVHQSRETLATIPLFSSTIAQIYRLIGQPVQPAWDITGWRFEVTKGSTEGQSEDLTVYSRLGNNSTGPLPYPLIGISLTDRFEESIGSRVLDPADYLPSDLDPRKLVERGDNFNAVITIKSASADATGFKLNVCYRSSDDRLRCAIDDFK